MKKIETSALIGLGAPGILFGRKMPGVKVIADAERVARYSAQPVVCNGRECHFDYVTPEQGQPVDLVLVAVKATVLEGVNLPADNHKAFLESMAPTFKPDGMPSMRQDVLAKRPTEVEQFAGAVRRLAQKHGMPTPANDFFYEKIREIEANYNK